MVQYGNGLFIKIRNENVYSNVKKNKCAVSSEKIIVVCGYMSYGTMISNILFLECSGFHVRHF